MTDYLDSLARLVALDTVSPIGDEPLERCASELSRLGCRPIGDRLFGFGDPAVPVWLYGHVDTKPIGPRADWKTEPLTLTERDGMLFGLGVSDSKFQLLNALAMAHSGRHFVLVDTSEETDGAPGAAAFVARYRPATLLICDGARGEADLYAGYSGQADGFFHLRTRRPTHHPARPGGDASELLRALLTAAADCPRFTLTGICAPRTERSLAVQEIDVRFDIRYGPDEEPTVDALLAAWPHTLRQSMAAVAGARTISVPGLVTGGLAPFSNRLGQLGPLKVDCLAVVPGADPDNRNHQPNEFIRIDQVERHQDVLRRVLDALDTEGSRHE